jgi:hypothetical protein
MNAIEIVLVIIAVGALALAAVRYFRPHNAADDLGQSPGSFAHPEDEAVSDRPSDDDRDAPLPRRPVRSRS